MALKIRWGDCLALQCGDTDHCNTDSPRWHALPHTSTVSHNWIYSKNILLITSSAGPYLEEDLFVANPTDDHVGSWHLPISREAESYISQRTHLNFERDIFCAWSPEHCVVGIQIYWVGPVGASNMPQPYSDSEQHRPDPNHGNLSSRPSILHTHCRMHPANITRVKPNTVATPSLFMEQSLIFMVISRKPSRHLLAWLEAVHISTSVLQAREGFSIGRCVSLDIFKTISH